MQKKEIYFIYDKKYKWSIVKYDESDDFHLYYYTGDQSIDDLMSISSESWSLFDEYVQYRAREIGTREAYNTFSELYRTLKEKVTGVGEVLDDIIKSDDSRIPF
jgi:hypothetical protein